MTSSAKNNTDAEYADVYDDKKATSSADDSSGHGVTNIGKKRLETKTKNPNKTKLSDIFKENLAKNEYHETTIIWNS